MSNSMPRTTYHHLREGDLVEADFIRWVDGAGVTVAGPFVGVVLADEGGRFVVEVRGCLLSGPKTDLRAEHLPTAEALVARFSKQSGTQFGTSLSGGRFRLR